MALVWLLAVAFASAAAVCPPGIEDAFFDGARAGRDLEQMFANGLAGMGAIKSADGRRAVLEIADEVLKILENPTPGITDPKWERTVMPYMRLFAKAAQKDPAYSIQLLERALIAANGLKYNGAYFTGLFERAATPGSSAWITNVSTAGHLFEVIAAKRWIDDGVIAADRVKGFGFRALVDDLSALEGDLVIRLPDGGEHWFDFKAAGAEAKLSQIAKAKETLLAKGPIKRFSFAYEDGFDPRSDPLFNSAVQAANQDLAAQGLAIEFVNAGAK
jgi:hypothetical protein